MRLKYLILLGMNVFVANGHGFQSIKNNTFKEFKIPEGCYVVTTAICGKTANLDMIVSLKEIVKNERYLNALQKPNDSSEFKSYVEPIFEVGTNEDVHIRKPGDMMLDIDFIPSPMGTLYKNIKNNNRSINEDDELMLFPPGLLDMKLLKKKQHIIREQILKNYIYSPEDFSATVYPPPPSQNVDGKNLNRYLKSKQIPISEIIKTPGVYILPICRSVPKAMKTIARMRRKMSFGGRRQRKTRKAMRRRQGGAALAAVRYVISSHGQQRTDEFSVPEGFEVDFYVKRDDELFCTIADENQVCNNITDIAPVQRFFGPSKVQDYELYSDEAKRWESRVLYCDNSLDIKITNKLYVFDPTETIKLSVLVKKIIAHHTKRYPKRMAEIHCLFCRV